MTPFQSLVLGLVQGLTEFLPVSSSGHLVIFQSLFGFTSPPVTFDILLHFATSLAVIVFFFPALLKLKLSYIKLLLIGSIPAGVVGLLLNNTIESLFNSVFMVGFTLIFTGCLLLATRKISTSSKQLTSKNSLIIGLFQALAIIPGISRSGSTISAALLQKVNHQSAFEFSFLLSLPAIFGATLLQLKHLSATNSQDLTTYSLGFILAFFAGLLSLKVLKSTLTNSHFYRFGYYCLALGVTVITYSLIKS